MSTETRIDDLIVAQGTTIKDIRTAMSGNAGEAAGNAAAIAALLTADPNISSATNLLAAILENAASIASNALTDTDGLTEGSTNLYFTEARVLASVLAGYAAGAGTVAATDTVIQAIQKLDGNIGALINDGAASASTTYSGTKIDADIAAAVANLVDSSPAALDTLNELAAALGDDANFATTINAAIALKANTADVYSKTDLGPNFDDKDWAAAWTTAIA